jgi:hypothetical protein
MDWALLAIGFLIGLFSGTMSGAFGIGASSITIVLLRTLLVLPAEVAVATALPLSILSALSGGAVYCQRQMMKYKTAIACGVTGGFFSVFGALATAQVPDEAIMLLVGLALVASACITLEGIKREKKGEKQAEQNVEEKLGYSMVVGAIAGFFSGFLGIGGGIILVPLLSRLRGMPYREAVPCSLFVMLIYLVPGAITHFGLGHVEVALLAALALGALIGAQFGARAAMNAKRGEVKKWFVRVLIFFGFVLLSNELVRMLLG